MEALKKVVREEIATEPMAVIDYVELYSFDELKEIETVENSNKLWEYERIESQIKNLWAISLPEESAEG